MDKLECVRRFVGNYLYAFSNESLIEFVLAALLNKNQKRRCQKLATELIILDNPTEERTPVRTHVQSI